MSISEANRDFATADFSAECWERIDRVCVQFERDWQQGLSPEIEDCLNGFEGPIRSALFSELLALDIEYRYAAGQTVARSDYETRFPDETMAIDSVFDVGDSSSLSRISSQKDPPQENLSLTSQYLIKDFHAQGGLGVIYVAHDKKFDRDVAIKFSRRRMPGSPEQTRLAREAEITGRLEHPGIAPVYATGQLANGLPCYVMQLIDGVTMHEAIDELHESMKLQTTEAFQSVEFRQLLQRFIDVCNTVEFAHRQGVIHRDIKPANIMLGSFGETFLLDWGLAKTLSMGEKTEDSTRSESPERNGDATEVGQILGTLAFASPEQISGDVHQHNAQSDVYSLGATLFTILVGKNPASANEMCGGAPPTRAADPCAVNPRIPASLAAICRKAMALKNAQRYPSAQALVHDLERYLAQEPISCFKESWRARIHRWEKKHPKIVSGIAAALVVGMVSLAISSYMLGSKGKQLANLNASYVSKNLELNEANSELTIQRDLAETASAKASNAFRTMTDHVLENIIGRQSDLTDTERELVMRGIERYKEYCSANGNDKHSIALKVEGLYRMGTLYKLLGNQELAQASYEQAIEYGLPHLSDDLEPINEFVARSCGELGFILKEAGQLEKAAGLISRADVEMSKLAAMNPNHGIYRSWLINSAMFWWEHLAWQRKPIESRKKLRDALVLAKQLESDFPNVLTYRLQLASVHNNLGVSLFSTGNLRESELHLRSARELLEDLVRRSPTNRRIHLSLASSTTALTQTLRRLDRREEAIELGKESIQILNSSLFNDQHSCWYVSKLIAAHSTLGAAYYTETHLPRAIEQYEHALRIIEESVSFHGNPEFDRTVLKARLRYSAALISDNRVADADHQYEISTDLARSICEQRPHEFSSLCDVHEYRGDLRVRQDRREEANKLYQQAETEYSERPSLVSENQVLRAKHRNVCWKTAWNLMKLQSYYEATLYWDRVIEIGRPDLGEVKAQTIRAVCIANYDSDLALQTVESIMKEESLQADEIYNLACASAASFDGLVDEKDAHRAQALTFDLLGQARALEYFDDPQRVQKLKSNSSFKSFHDHPDFVDLIAGLESQDLSPK